MSVKQQKVSQRGTSPLYEEIEVQPAVESEGIVRTIDHIEAVMGGALQEGDVTVISGANYQPFPLAGRTVADARTMLQDAMNIGPHALVLVNGRPVGGDGVLQQGDTLEFVKEGGEKGARQL